MSEKRFLLDNSKLSFEDGVDIVTKTERVMTVLHSEHLYMSTMSCKTRENHWLPHDRARSDLDAYFLDLNPLINVK